MSTHNAWYIGSNQDRLRPYLVPIKQKGTEFGQSGRKQLNEQEILFMKKVPTTIVHERLKWEAFQAGAEGRGIDVMDPAEFAHYALPHVKACVGNDLPKRYPSIVRNDGSFYAPPHPDFNSMLDKRWSHRYYLQAQQKQLPLVCVGQQMINDMDNDLAYLSQKSPSIILPKPELKKPNTHLISKYAALTSPKQAPKKPFVISKSGVSKKQVKVTALVPTPKKQVNNRVITPKPVDSKIRSGATLSAPVLKKRSKYRTIEPDTDDVKVASDASVKPRLSEIFQKEINRRNNMASPEQQAALWDSMKTAIMRKREEEQAEKEKALRQELKKGQE